MSRKGYRLPLSPWHCFYYSFERNNDVRNNDEKYKGTDILKVAAKYWGEIKNTRLDPNDNHLEIIKTFDYWEKVAELVEEYQIKQYEYYISTNKNMSNYLEIPEQDFDNILKSCLIIFGGHEYPKVQKFKIDLTQII